jgi:hypothetical protein
MARKSKKRPSEEPVQPGSETEVNRPVERSSDQIEDRRQSPAGRPDREAAEDAGAAPRRGRPGPVFGEEDIADEHRPPADRDITDEDLDEDGGSRGRDPRAGLAIADEEVEPDTSLRRERR